MVEQMGIPMALAFQMMGKFAEIPGRAKWQLQVIFLLLQTVFHMTCMLVCVSYHAFLCITFRGKVLMYQADAVQDSA